MIFFNSVFDRKPTNFGDTVKYLFSNSKNVGVEYDSKNLANEEFFNYYSTQDIKTMTEAEVWQYSKLYLFGSVIIN